MTSGQPFQPPAPAAQPVPSFGAALTAPTSPPSPIRTIVGAVAACAALALIVFSFFSWYSGSATIEAGTASVSMDVSVTGMGSGEATMVIVNAPEIARKALEAQMQKSEQEFVNEADEKSKSPGIWTIVFGVIVAAGAVALLIGRYTGIGALVTAVGGLAATIAAIVFVSNPEGALGMKNSGDRPDNFSSGAGWGLWIVLIGALAALVAGAVAVAMTARPGLFGGGSATAAVPAGYSGPPQQFGQAPQQFGQAPQQAGFPPVPPQQPGSYPSPPPQQPGQQGFPPQQ